jgi:hypothetical protein
MIPGSIAFLLSAERRTTTGAAATWIDTVESKIVEPLFRIQQCLGRSPETLRVLLYPQCTPGVALRIGSLFHHSTGFSIQCAQGKELWDLDRHELQASCELDQKHDDDKGSDGLHLLLSFAQSVRGGYEKWRESSDGRAPIATLELSPVAGPSRFSVSKDEAVTIAAQVVRHIFRTRGMSRKLRIFCAVPNALAIALGRELNALGEIVTMDWDKDSGAYFETTRFRTS